jgi:hypothetical protein
MRERLAEALNDNFSPETSLRSFARSRGTVAVSEIPVRNAN